MSGLRTSRQRLDWTQFLGVWRIVLKVLHQLRTWCFNSFLAPVLELAFSQPIAVTSWCSHEPICKPPSFTWEGVIQQQSATDCYFLGLRVGSCGGILEIGTSVLKLLCKMRRGAYTNIILHHVSKWWDLPQSSTTLTLDANPSCGNCLFKNDSMICARGAAGKDIVFGACKNCPHVLHPFRDVWCMS